MSHPRCVCAAAPATGTSFACLSVCFCNSCIHELIPVTHPLFFPPFLALHSEMRACYRRKRRQASAESRDRRVSNGCRLQNRLSRERRERERNFLCISRLLPSSSRSAQLSCRRSAQLSCRRWRRCTRDEERGEKKTLAKGKSALLSSLALSSARLLFLPLSSSAPYPCLPSKCVSDAQTIKSLSASLPLPLLL